MESPRRCYAFWKKKEIINIFIDFIKCFQEKKKQFFNRLSSEAKPKSFERFQSNIFIGEKLFQISNLDLLPANVDEGALVNSSATYC